MAPLLLGTFVSMMLSSAFNLDDVYLHTGTDGKLFNLARLKAQTKMLRVLVRDMLFADNAALATHTEEYLQKVMDRFSHVCKQIGLAISVRKTNVMAQDVITPPSINIDNVTLDIIDQFAKSCSTVTSNVSLDAE